MAIRGKAAELLVRLNPELCVPALYLVYQEGSAHVVCRDQESAVRYVKSSSVVLL